MKTPESFLVLNRRDSPVPVIVLTKNCTTMRAKQLWDKFLRKNVGFYDKGAYVVVHTTRHFRHQFTVRNFNGIV